MLFFPFRGPAPALPRSREPRPERVCTRIHAHTTGCITRACGAPPMFIVQPWSAAAACMRTRNVRQGHSLVTRGCEKW